MAPTIDYEARAQWRTLNVIGASPVASTPSMLRATGLLDEPDSAVIITGVNSGVVHLHLEALSMAPASSDAAWEDVAEASFRSEDTILRISGPFDDATSQPGLAVAHGAELRMRVSARGRDVEFDLVASQEVEHYLVQVWESPSAAPVALRITSRSSHDWAR